MAKEIFDVTRDEGRLVLTKCCGPAFEEVLFVSLSTAGVIAIGSRFLSVPTVNGPVPLIFQLTVPFGMLMWAGVTFCAAAKFWRAIQGERWTFDVNTGTIGHNGVRQLVLEDIACICVVEDKENYLCHQFWMISRSGKKMVLEDNADELEKLVRVAKHISEFTGLEAQQ